MIKTVLVLSLATYIMSVFMIYKKKPSATGLRDIKDDKFYLLITALFPLFCIGLSLLFSVFWLGAACFVAMAIIIAFIQQPSSLSQSVSVEPLPTVLLSDSQIPSIES